MSEKNEGGTYNESITGAFKDGFRDGAWHFTITKVDWPNSSGTYTTETTTSVQSFKSGTPHGLWKLNSTYKTRPKIIVYGRYVWGAYDTPYTEYASTNYSNGHLTGVTTSKLADKKTAVTVTINQHGFLTGNHVFQMTYENEEVTCNEKGILTKMVRRDKKGNVKSKYDIEPELLQIAEKHLKNEITTTELKEKRIIVDTSYANEYTNLQYIFERDHFVLRHLGGDKTYNAKKSSLQRNYGMYIVASKIAYIDISKDYVLTEMRRSKNIEGYEGFIERNRDHLRPEDISLLLDEKERYLANKEFERKFNEDIEVIRAYVASDNKYFISEDFEIEKVIYEKAKPILEDINQSKTALREVVTYLLKAYEPIKQYGNTLDEYLSFDFKGLQQKSGEYSKDIVEIVNPTQKAIDTALVKGRKADLKIFEVKSAYGKINIENIPNNSDRYTYMQLFNSYKINSYGADKFLPSNDVKLYKQFEDFIEVRKKELKACSDIKQMLIVVEGINAIGNKVIALKGQDIKGLLKLLKKEPDFEKRITLLLNY
ncbi:MAG: hypothetical protein H6584_02520 [Flavobacteriales bacterium]|nr:hypothetical protein [Flavobacteriales bacterium]